MTRKRLQCFLSLLLLLGSGSCAQADRDDDFEDVEFMDEDEDLGDLFDELGIDPEDEEGLDRIIDSSERLLGAKVASKPKKGSKKKQKPEVSGEYAALIQRSPFLPPGYEAYDDPDEEVSNELELAQEAPPPPAQDLEMTAMVVSASGDVIVSLRNRSGDSFLVRKSDPKAVYKLTDFDIPNKSVILDDGFSKKTLKLVEPEPTASQIKWDQLNPQASSPRRAPTPEEIEEERETAELLKRLLED